MDRDKIFSRLWLRFKQPLWLPLPPSSRHHWRPFLRQTIRFCLLLDHCPAGHTRHTCFKPAGLSSSQPHSDSSLLTLTYLAAYPDLKVALVLYLRYELLWNFPNSSIGNICLYAVSPLGLFLPICLSFLHVDINEMKCLLNPAERGDCTTAEKCKEYIDTQVMHAPYSAISYEKKDLLADAFQ